MQMDFPDKKNIFHRFWKKTNQQKLPIFPILIFEAISHSSFLDNFTMFKAKFFRVAGSLDAKNWKRFKKFVHRSGETRSDMIPHFLDRVAPAHPEFEASWIAREALHKRVFPDLPHSDQRLYDHLSYLYDLLETFLLAENRHGDLLADELILTDYFRRAGLMKDFQHATRKAQQKLDVSPNGAVKALAQYRLNSEQEVLYSEQLKEQARTKADGLQEKMDALEFHFLRVRFQYACEMLNRETVVGTSYDTSTLANAMQMYEAFPQRYTADPAIGAYYQVLRMFLHPEDGQAYQAWKKIIDDESHNFPADEARTLYVYAQNFCIRRVNQGKAEYSTFLFDLYLEMLDRGSMYQEDMLSQWDYKNIVSLGLHLGKRDWVTSFIESQRERIAPDYRENAYAYNRAYFDYATHNYPGALKQLQKVEFSDVFYHLGTKAIQMKIYYELEETEALISLFTTFKTYLRRQKGISVYQRQTHLILVKFVQQLDRIRERANRTNQAKRIQELETLQEKVLACDGVSNLQWLLEQIEQLMPSKTKSQN